MRNTEMLHKIALAVVVVTSILVLFMGAVWGTRFLAQPSAQASTTAQPTDIAVGGFPMTKALAPNFTLVNQFGKKVTLSSFRGHEVVLAFIDSQCKTVCPLTAQIMYDARTQLGTTVANKIDLIAVNANPDANNITDVQSWSITHGMLHQWQFLTGSSKQLQSVYSQYKIYVQVNSDGQVVHDAAMLIIDPQGYERLYFETLNSNSTSDLQSEVLGLESGMKQWLA